MKFDLQKYEHDLLSGINRFCRSYQSRPYDYLTEADMQAALYSFMVDAVREHPPISFTHGAVGLIHSEYLKAPASRVDLVALDPTRVPEEVGSARNRFSYLYSIPCFMGIEIKSVQVSERKGVNPCISDLDKLSELKRSVGLTHALALCFLHRDEDFDVKAESLERMESVTDLDHIYIVSPTAIARYKSPRETMIEHS